MRTPPDNLLFRFFFLFFSLAYFGTRDLHRCKVREFTSWGAR